MCCDLVVPIDSNRPEYTLVAGQPRAREIPSPENRDLPELLWRRHRLVQMRTRIMNQLQARTLAEQLPLIYCTSK